MGHGARTLRKELEDEYGTIQRSTVPAVISLAAATMQHLGKTLNPLTNKVGKEPEAAQSTIDMLDTLEAKTKATWAMPKPGWRSRTCWRS